ncbi:MAG: lipopolysaccharide assembly protein LapA domain-containing protein [Planctomycetaceae bacterium]|jgi:putative membrane protein
MNQILVYLAIAFGIVVLIFSLQNMGAVDVTFLIWTASIPKVLLILGTYLLGMFSGWALLAIFKTTVT